jgi:Ca2+:H+ antiporter
VKAVRPYCWVAAVLLFASYIVGLFFTLRTHAAVIWATDVDEKKPLPAPQPTTEVSPFDTRHQSITNTINSLQLNSPPPQRDQAKDSALYKRTLGQSLQQVGLHHIGQDGDLDQASILSKPGSQVRDMDQHLPKSQQENNLPYVVPPKSSSGDMQSGSPRNITVVPGLSDEDNSNLVRQVAEMAATAATVAAKDVTRGARKNLGQGRRSQDSRHRDASRQNQPSTTRTSTAPDHANVAAEHAVHPESGGHDAPNWSRTKSYVILLTATVAYAAVAEVLVNTVDVVLQSVDIGEKFLGITLFALVPNTTEFLNAISFAMNGNIALSMEIGSAYALQVCLLQIPTLVLYSAVIGRYIDLDDLVDHTFSLIFPQWDMVTVILCVFLLSYMVNEGKSNYFKGSILVMTYLVVVMGFYYSGYTTMDVLGVDPSDTLAMSSRYLQGGVASVGTTRSRGEL